MLLRRIHPYQRVVRCVGNQSGASPL
ncbi:hypothetical protein G0Q07_13555 [Draconibacterium halophilum]|uniref:Uncharacterized protein n=1 Tax=Draconibacterium halophilum TaxID=2706887 RepID=A0A6C0RK34_9BACT|nr:hypothetical protein G0Q07_13555 [Draconibacterium halophilum]